MIKRLFAIFSIALTASAFVNDKVRAGDIKPAILYDLGGKFDKSFNENAFNGADKFKKDKGVQTFEFELSRETEREQALRTYARQGASPIIMVGFAWSLPLTKIAPQYPNAKFVIIDSLVDAPNVQSIQFAYNEGAFVVGALAGLKSASGAVGFVGGMDIPIIRNYGCGFEAGALFINPNIKFIENMVGTTPSAWTDPARARELALGQFDRGVDVVFGAAGGSTAGVLQAAADAKKLAIGVGTNQNGAHPGSVLTSATANIDVAVYKSLADAYEGNWKGGSVVLGVREKGVSWALDDNNRPLLTDADVQKIQQIEADISEGKVKVPKYLETGACK